MIEEKIKEFEKNKNILIGICDNGILNCGIQKKIPFVNRDLSDRLNPTAVFEKCKSIIVIAVPYGKKINFTNDNEKRGRISLSAVGKDYHVLVKNLLEELMYELNKIKEIEYKIYVDSSELIERELAKKAGIGYQGKNCCLITEKFGSFVFLGYALIDIELTPSFDEKYYNDICGDCNICINACPSSALKAFDLDPFKCVSYLTQSKEEVPEEMQNLMANSIYGCDICQSSCPKNIGKYISELNDIDSILPKLENLKFLTNKEFKDIYGDSALFWRGRNTITRNAGIAEKNYSKMV